MRNLKLSVLIAALSAASFSAVKAQTADDIIKKHIEAIGGPANWDKIKSIKLTGDLSVQGMNIGMTTTVVNNTAMRADISAAGMNGYTIITKTEGWRFMPMQGDTKAVPLPADAVKMSQEKLDVKFGQLVDKSDITKAELAGTDSVNKMKCYKVIITDKDNNVTTAYFDVNTYYIARVAAKIKDESGQEQDAIYDMSDYRKQPEGIVYPMQLHTDQADITYKTIEINKPIDDKIFKPSN